MTGRPRTRAERAAARNGNGELSPPVAVAIAPPAASRALELRVDVSELAEAVVDLVMERLDELLVERTRQGPEPWLNAEEAAVHLRRPLSRIRALTSRARDGRVDGIPHHRVGSSVLYRASELDEWVRSGDASL